MKPLFNHLIFITLIISSLNLTAQSTNKSDFIDTTKDEYIIGGEETKISSFPWQIAIVRKDIGSNFEGQYCSGVIINDRWVLTAAHCLDDLTEQDIKVVAGVTSLLSSNPHEFDVSLASIHPEYFNDGFAIHNDIALIKIRGIFDLTDENISTVPFVTSEDVNNGLADPGVLATIIGWGDTTNLLGEYSEILRVATVPIVSNEVANEPVSYDGKIKEYMLAAGFAEGGVDACAADSGGPLMVPNQNNDGFIVAGLISWGLGCAQPNNYGIYTRVSVFESWIQEQLIISGIDDINEKPTLKFFPNPADNFLNIEFEGNNLALSSSFQIFNILGDKVYENHHINPSKIKRLNIDISNLKSGVYFIKTNLNGQNLVKKFIVE